ncbi:ABC transporter ATP-binding protein [Entomohabitans teleogrylli]|uniref:ABC transporter ATP-binding protein n=1 Tax=Entomohabitans teleogrylli TaxID=1384589 RepID=UPI00073D31CA|nr:ABC transporter ATP-binding protein [Entomohabitans teleogrylli]
MEPTLLRIEELSVTLPAAGRKLLHNISLDLAPNTCLGIMGESGSGKSLLCRAIMGLTGSEFRRSGKITFLGADLTRLDEKQMRRYRGPAVSIVLQHPMSAFDPLQPVGKQMIDSLRAHLPLTVQEARDQALAMLQQVGLSHAAQRFHHYPSQLSGGMLQRVTIAIALGLKPRLLIADEPTTALDSVSQAEIIALLARLRAENDMALLMVSHNPGVIRQLADRAIVMQAGQIVEDNEIHALFHQPQHPHTRELIGAWQALQGRYRHALLSAATSGAAL